MAERLDMAITDSYGWAKEEGLFFDELNAGFEFASFYHGSMVSPSGGMPKLGEAKVVCPDADTPG